MSELELHMSLRIYADFNSGGSSDRDPCWCLRYGKDFRPLDELETELELQDGMPVILYYEDSSEEFEVSATLRRSDAPSNRWRAFPDWKTYRKLR
jgi:hypothetical protein